MPVSKIKQHKSNSSVHSKKKLCIDIVLRQETIFPYLIHHQWCKSWRCKNWLEDAS